MQCFLLATYESIIAFGIVCMVTGGFLYFCVLLRITPCLEQRVFQKNEVHIFAIYTYSIATTRRNARET